MAWNKEQLDAIFARTDGYCHLCPRRERLARSRYGEQWEVEHSVAQANGGSNHGNNLFAAHVACNRAKGTMSSSTYRAGQGLSGPPKSAAQKAKAREANATGGAVLGALVGALFGPVGVVVCAGIGVLAGNAVDPEARRRK